jgi:hypothetical protein
MKNKSREKSSRPWLNAKIQFVLPSKAIDVFIKFLNG